MNTWDRNLTEASDLLVSLRPLGDAIRHTGGIIVETLRTAHKVLACGNGGSASQASHLCAELVGRYRRPRRPLNAVCLCSDGPLLTCLVNDFDPRDLFARQVRGLGQPGDCLIGLSTSGASENVARAIQAAREGSLKTIALLGRSGDPAVNRPVLGLADHEIVIPHSTTARIQETHLLVIHTWCDMIDAALGELRIEN